MDLQQVTLNGQTFSKYECKIAIAIKLYIRNNNNQTPNDESVGYVMNFMRNIVDGVPMNCEGILPKLRGHAREDHRAIYLAVYCDRRFWESTARDVWMDWLRQNDEIVQRSVAESLPYLIERRVSNRTTD